MAYTAQMKQAKAEKAELRKLQEEKLLRLYRELPVVYAQQVLKVDWWSVQREIAEALVKYKRVFVKSGHSLGKSHLAAGLALWFFNTHNPGICITTAPTEDSVKDILWKEIRSQCPPGLRPLLFPAAPRMQTSEKHFIVGMTASSGTAFHGRHEENIFLIYDECVGIGSEFWDAGESMMSSANCYWLASCNPTDTSCEAYSVCMNNPLWHVIDISCLDHPNVLAELEGKPVLHPGAVNLPWIYGRLEEWCEKVPAGDVNLAKGDFEFPKGSGDWYRPGPVAEPRLLGRWPSQGSTSVWTEAMFASCLVQRPVDTFEKLVIGCDKARFGDDFTSITVRRGRTALHHETHNGWDNGQIAGRLIQLCEEYATGTENPKQITCLIDDMEGSITSHSNGYNFQGINSNNKAIDEEGFPNRRSELWFAAADRAREGRMDLSRLSKDSLKLLRTQCMAPIWKVDSQGRRVVEPKEQTKKRLRRSPDDMDSLNLSYYGGVSWREAAEVVERQRLEHPSQVLAASSIGSLW